MTTLPRFLSDSMLDGDSHDLGSLLCAAGDGDRAALDEIVRLCYGRVEKAVRGRLRLRFRGRQQLIRAQFSTGDVVHGVFLKVLSGRLRIENPTLETLIGYLVQAIENQIVDMTRFHQASRRDVRRREVSGEDDAPSLVTQLPSRTGTPSQLAVGNEQSAIFAEVMRSFSERERRVLKLRIERQSSFEDIAKQVGFKTADVARKAFHAAKAKLLVRLRARGLGPESAGEAPPNVDASGGRGSRRG